MSAPAKKAAKPRSAPSHPSFKDMIAAAIKSLGDRKGSSRHAIRKYISENYKVGEKAVKGNLNKSLAKLLQAGYLAHPKTSTGLYKLNKTEQAKAVTKKKPAPKKKAAAKKQTKADGVKKAPIKKPKAKKAAGAKKAAAKKPAKKTVKKVAAKKPAAKKSPKKSAKKAAKKTTASKKK